MSTTGASAITRVATRIPDTFLIALDAFMRRTGQGAHVSQSWLELDRAPDLGRLRAASRRFVEKHPLVAGTLCRSLRTWLNHWSVPGPPARGLPLGLWRETGSPGALGPEASEVADGSAALIERTRHPLAEDGISFHARLDVLERRDGNCVVALSWSHVLIDGKGAELIFAELGRLADGQDISCDSREIERPAASFGEKFQRAKKAVLHFAKIDRLKIRSLSGPRAHAVPCRYQLLTLSPEESAIVRRRAEAATGSLFPLPYYLACATRAHDAVFRHRGGKLPGGYVTSIPIQMRRRGGRGPLFQNHMTILFFASPREELATLEGAAASLKKQFADMTRDRLDDAFNTLLEMMRRVPPRIFMAIVRTQFRGEISSFYHSHTGQFAPEITSFAGARIENTHHLPCLGSPPGTGVFLLERGDRVNVAVSWREGCLSDDERKILLEQLFADLLGTPAPTHAV